MGHTIDPLDYNRAPQQDPEWAKKQYMKFAPYIQIMSNPRAFSQVDEDIVEELRQRNTELKTQLNSLESGKMQELEKQVAQLANALKRVLDETEKENQDSAF